MNDFLQRVKDERIVMIYRGFSPDECVEMTDVLFDAGVRFFEVTMNTPNAFKAIEKLSRKFGKDAYIGGGTVLKTTEVEEVRNVGGEFIVSPNVKEEVIQLTKKLGMYSVPGAFTPTEILTAWDAGADVVKVFPINVVGMEHIKQIRGPLSDIPLMATGGVTLDMVGDLFTVGVDSIAMSVHLLGKEMVDTKNWDAIRAKIAEFQKAAGVRVRGQAVS